MSDQPPSSGEPAKQEVQPKKGRTIDLKATEIKAANAESDSASGAQPPTVDSTAEVDTASPEQGHAGAGPEPVSRKHMGLRALIAGAVAGAVVAAAIVGAELFVRRDSEVAALGGRVSRVEDQIRETSTGDLAKAPEANAIAGLAERISKLESAAAASGSTPAVAAMADRVSNLERDLKALSDRTGSLARMSEQAAGAAREAAQRAQAAAASLAEIAQKVESLSAKAGGDKLAGDVQSLTSRVAVLEGAMTKVRDSSGRLAAAAIALDFAVESGAPFVPELLAAKSLAPDPGLLASLEPFAASGVPTSAGLGRELLEVLPSLRAAQESHGSFLTRLQVNAEKLVRIRPDQEQEGTDVPVILGRLETKANNADIPGALAELAHLPAGSRAAAGAWIEKAKARSAGLEASQKLLATALAGITR